MARLFDGSNDALSTATPPTTSTTMSMCGWFNVTAGTSQVLLSLGTNGSANNKRDVLYATGTTQFQARSVNNAGTVASAVVTAVGLTGVWVFLAGVWSGVANRTIYANTTSGNNTTSNSPNAPDQFRVGLSNSGTTPLNGRAAEVAMWDIALTPADIAMLATGLCPIRVRPESLLSYWPVVGRTSPEIDVVGANGLSLVDAPAAAAHPRIYAPRSRSAMVRTAVSAAPKRYLLVR